MKVKLGTLITDFYGTPLPKAYFGFQSAEPTDLCYVCVTALGLAFQDEKGLPPEEKMKRYALAIKLLDAGKSMELSAEEATMIKNLVNKWTTPVVCGQVDRLLEGKPTGIKLRKVSTPEK